MVKVVLAGMNVPIKILEEIKELKQDVETGKESDESKLSWVSHKLGELAQKFTPEILCAAYARISRKPEDVNKLVEEAYQNVLGARKSNERIIYGMGHHSVADHPVFNFNITGVSRLLVEEVEKRRIGCGYTEKSQRYITLGADLSDTVEPPEYSPEDLKKHKELVLLQNSFYAKAYKKLLEHLKRKNSDKITQLNKTAYFNSLKSFEGSAKEDARYGIGFARMAQLGCSYDGEALELTIRRLKYGRLLEGKELAKQLFDAVMPYAPSLIQLTDAEIFRQHNPGQELQDEHFKHSEQNLRELVAKTFSEEAEKIGSEEVTECNELIGYLEDGNASLVTRKGIKPDISEADLNITAALLHEYSQEYIGDCYWLAYHLIKEKKAQGFVKQALKYLSPFDKAPRAFENTGGMIFEAIVSASCFAQLKRHRPLTELSQDYNPKLGITVPPNIEEAGLEGDLGRITDRSAELYYEFLPKYGKAAEYCLTNAHNRRVLMNINIRELIHFSRTREDEHAQWDIRGLANSMSRLARLEAPITASYLGGQSELLKKYKKA